MKVQVCRMCGVELNENNWKQHDMKKHIHLCAKCSNIYHKKYRKLYYERHKDRILEMNRKYKEKHKDKIREIHQRYYAKNKEKIKEYVKNWRKQHRELIMSLSDEEFLDVVFPDRRNKNEV